MEGSYREGIYDLISEAAYRKTTTETLKIRSQIPAKASQQRLAAECNRQTNKPAVFLPPGLPILEPRMSYLPRFLQTYLNAMTGDYMPLLH